MTDTKKPQKVRLNKTNLDKLKAADGKRRIVWDSSIQGYGVRIMPSGGKTLFFQARFKGEIIRVTIGRYTGVSASAEAGRKHAKEINADLANGIDPRPEKKAAEAATFGDMLQGYVELLEQKGKKSALAVKNQITADIEKTQRKLWKKRAAEIDIDDCVKIVADVKDRGKLRQADKIRSYIRSAFTEAIKARGNVNAPANLRNMNIKTNPARDMVKIEGSSQAKTRALSLSEFQCYWKRIKEQPEPARTLAIIHVLTGGQRIKQLSRVTTQDIDREDKTMTILDYKGRRSQPYQHKVPLLPEVLSCIDRITGAGEYVFSCDGGIKPAHELYLNDLVKRIRKDMEKAGELEKGAFTAGTIRATIETRLGKDPYKVPRWIRGYLASHGLGGVQARNYEHDDYIEEKLDALQKLQRMVEGKPEPTAQIIPFNREAIS